MFRHRCRGGWCPRRGSLADGGGRLSVRVLGGLSAQSVMESGDVLPADGAAYGGPSGTSRVASRSPTIVVLL